VQVYIGLDCFIEYKGVGEVLYRVGNRDLQQNHFPPLQQPHTLYQGDLFCLEYPVVVDSY